MFPPKHICFGLLLFTQWKSQPYKHYLTFFLRQKTSLEHPSRYKNCKIPFTLLFIQFAFNLFHLLSSHLYPSQAKQVSCPSSVFFPPSSGGEAEAQVTQTPRDAWGCQALDPCSKPQTPSFGCRQCALGSELSGHPELTKAVLASPQEVFFSAWDPRVEKLLSLRSRTMQRSLLFALKP